jgi:hypothetical protein
VPAGTRARVARQQRTEFRFNAVERRPEDLAPRHDHYVNGDRWFMVTEQFPDEPLRAVPFEGGPHLPGRCYSETGWARLTFPREHGHQAAGTLETCVVDELKVGPLSDVLRRPETDHLLLVGHGQSLAPLGASTLQHLAAVLCCHANQETMTLCAPAGIWLKRPLPLLGSGHFSPQPLRLRYGGTLPKLSTLDSAEAGRSNFRL